MEEDLIGRVTSVTSRSVLGQNVGHKMVEVEITEGLELGKGYWKLNTSLLRDENYANLIKETWIEAREDKNDFANVGEWWDFVKILMRNLTVDFAKTKRQEERRVIRELEKEKKRLMGQMQLGYASVLAEEQLKQIEAKLKLEEERLAEGCRIRARVPNWETKDPGISYFSREERKGSKRNLIHALKDTDGRVKTGTERVVKITHDFYTELFDPIFID